MKKAIEIEFSRPFLVDRVAAKGSHEKLVATGQECAQLAVRFGVPAVQDFRALLKIVPWRGGGLKVTGRIDAKMTRISVISLDAFESGMSFEVEQFYLPHGVAVSDDDDVIPISGPEIDLGELVAEVCALDLDPYPRKPGEAFEGFEASGAGGAIPLGRADDALKKN